MSPEERALTPKQQAVLAAMRKDPAGQLRRHPGGFWQLTERRVQDQVHYGTRSVEGLVRRGILVPEVPAGKVFEHRRWWSYGYVLQAEWR